MRTTLLAIGIWGVAFGSVASARQDPAQSGPQASTPAQATAPPQVTPPQTPPASPPAPQAAATAETTTSSGEFDFGGRGTSITGDVARYNRFRDLSDGLFFDNFSTKMQRKGWYYDFGGTHAGRQDAVYSGEVTLPGRLTFMGSYQAVPWNISSASTTKTIFANTGTGVLTIPDYVQSLLQTSSANISQVVPNNLTPIALQAHRKYSQGGVEFMVDPNTTLDFHVLRMDRGGTIVGEGTFGFSSAQELPLPVIQHQTEMNAGAERAKGDWLFRVGYLASWFSNEDQSITWDNPYKLTDATNLSSRGRLALAPNSFLQTFSGTAAVKLAHRSRLVGTMSFGTLSNDTTLLPETINTAMPTFTLDRTTLQGSAHTTSGNLIFTSHPTRTLDVDVRYRYYQYDGRTPEATQLLGRIEYDSTIEMAPLSSPHVSVPLDLTTHTFDAAATLDVRRGSLGFGYTRDGSAFNERIFGGTGMNTERVTYDTMGTSWLDLHARYSHSTRRGSDFDNSDLIADGEQPTLQHFDVADRNENVGTLTASVLFHSNYSFNLSAGGGKDDFPQNQDPTNGFGLANASFTTYSAGIAGTPTENLSFSLSYDRNKYTTDQQSRAANPGVQAADPTRNWSANGNDIVHSVLGDIDVKHVLVQKLGLKGTLNVNKGSTLYLYGLAPNTTLPAVSQLPAVDSQLTRVTFDVHYSVTERATVGFGYWYEKFTVHDFAMGGPALAPYAIPSLLTLGNAILPYTANTFFVRLLYHW
jgi:MtrB/PioB family decaheme-associated outer membrane protein